MELQSTDGLFTVHSIARAAIAVCATGLNAVLYIEQASLQWECHYTCMGAP